MFFRRQFLDCYFNIYDMSTLTMHFNQDYFILLSALPKTVSGGKKGLLPIIN
jgi:hypothetical protein